MTVTSAWPKRAGSLGRAIARSVLLAHLATACSAWHPQSEPTGIVFAHPVGRARVVLADGSTVEFRDARVERDSVVARGGRDQGRMAVAISEVRAIEVREGDFTRTALLGIAVIAAYLVAVVIALSTAGGDF